MSLNRIFFAIIVLLVISSGTSHALKAPHSSPNITSCADCHSRTGAGFSSITSFNNLCINAIGCHKPAGLAGKKAISTLDPSNRFGNLPSVNGSRRSSHGWKIPNTNIDAGATETNKWGELSVGIGLALNNRIFCTRCHRAHGEKSGYIIYNKFLRQDPKGDYICFQCHAARRIGNVRDSLPFGKHYSHPVEVDYNAAKSAKPDYFEAAPLNPYSSNPSAALKLYTTYGGTKNAVVCSTCHGPIHSSDSNPYTFDSVTTYSKTGNYSTSSGNLLRRYPATKSNDLCTSCHKVQSHRNFMCSRCHAPHKKAGEQNRYLILENISTPNSGKRAVQFVSTSAMAKRWTDGNNAICQVCHTATRYHRNYSTTAAKRDHNYLGSNKYKFCPVCHSHTRGFLGESLGNMACGTSGCHDDYFNQMNTANKGYHHYLNNANITNLASGSKYPVINPPSPLGGQSDQNRRCLMCHVEHDIFKPELNSKSPGRSYNLRFDIATLPNRTTHGHNSDYNAANIYGGLCLSCHQNSQTKSYTKADGTTKTPIINKALFDGSPHNYVADSTFDNGATVFKANCSKCHIDTMNKSKQGAGNQFGPHYSVIRRLNALMINENNTGTISSATSSTLVDTTKTWGTDIWVSRTVKILEGTGASQSRTITGNNSTALTVSPAWTTTPNATSKYLIGDSRSIDSGLATGATSTSLSDSTKTWTTNYWSNRPVTIIAGTGYGQTRKIVTNTATQITIETAAPWTTIPDSTSNYSIGDPAEEELCYRCHSRQTNPNAGLKKDYYGVKTFDNSKVLKMEELYNDPNKPYKHRVDRYFAKHRGDEAENAPESNTTTGWINDTNTTNGLHTGCADCHNPHGNRKPGEDSGIATGGSGSTLTDTTKNWSTDQWRGYTLKLGDGTGKGQNTMIVFNTNTTLHVGITYVTPPAGGANATYYFISPVGMPDKGNNLWNPNSGTWGVGVTYPTTPALNTMEEPVFTKNKNLVGGTNKIYELCFKCHSEYGWGANGTPFTIPDSLGSSYGSYVEGRTTNIAQEFNPKNLGHHPLVEIGNNQPIIPLGDNVNSSNIEGPFAATGGLTSAINYTNTWTPSKYSGQCVEITSGTGAGQIRSISSHTTTSITVDPGFSTVPDATSQFYIRKCSIYNTGSYGGGTSWPRFTGGTITLSPGSSTATITGLINGIPSTAINGWYLYAGALKTGADSNDTPVAGSCTTTAKCPPMLATKGWFQVKGISPRASSSGTTTVTLTLSPTPTAGYSGTYALSAGLGNTFVPPYGPWSVIGCADCHDSPSPEEPQGPHASSRQWILKTLEAQSFGWFYGGVDGSTTTSDATQVKMIGYPAGDDSGWELNNVKYTCLNCHRADVYGSEGKSPAWSMNGSPDGTCAFCHGSSEGGWNGNGPAPSGASFTNFAWRPMSRLVHIPTGYIGYGGYAANSYGISCMNCHGGDNRVNKDSDPSYSALGGIHGSNLGVGSGTGTSSFRGRRLLNGAVWRGVTRATTGTGVTCSYQLTDSVNNCGYTNVDPSEFMEPVGGTYSGWINAAYPYYSGSDIYLPVMTSAIAYNATGGGNGAGAGDTVVIKFDGETDAPAINAGNIATALSLNNGHSWKDGSGAIGSATWSTTTYTNDTLTIMLSANSGPPTVAVGDVVTSGGTIKTVAGTPVTNSISITGTFDVKLKQAEAKDNSGGGAGVQAGDQVVIKFDSSTGGTAINAGNINSALSLNNGHSWLDGSGAVSGAVWSTTTNVNDTLTITLSANTSVPTVAKNDTVTLGTVIKDNGGNTITGSVMITGSFDSVLPGTGTVTAGWWKLNENSGSTTYDESINNNHGTITSATWTTGKFGSSALNFSVTAYNYVQVPDSNSLDLTTAGTLEAWVYPTSQSYRPTIIAKGTTNGYQLTSGYNNGRIAVRWGNNNDDLTSVSALTLNQWSHVAATYDGASLKIYINGQLDNSVAYTTNAVPNTSPLLIGSGSTSGAYSTSFGGKIEEVAIYNRALTAGEVRQRFGARFTSAGASDTSGLGAGIQAGDQVVIKFDGATNGPAITASNIDSVLNTSHSWKDGSGAIGSAVWSTTSYANDTLTISLSANTSVPTIAIGDTIMLNGTIKDTLNRPIMDAMTISGGFDVPYGSVAYWTFNEATGNTIYDGTSNANNATLSTGTRVTAGYSGNAIMSYNGFFNVYAASSNSLNLTTAGTVELWAKKNSNASNQTYVSKGNSTQYQLMESGTTGKLALRWGHDLEDIVSNSVLPIGKWNHIVATYDGASLNLYINGQLDKMVAYTTNAVANSYQLNIGSGPSGGNPLDGMIDQVGIYNYALSATEVRNHYKIRLDSASAADMSAQGPGIQAGDTVTIMFKGGTSGPAINAGNVNTVLALNGSHTWGSISSAVWSTTRYANDTLTVILNTGATVGIGDTITLGGSILNSMADPIVDSITISGTFGTTSLATPNATGYWKMDEGAGSTTADATENGNTGTITGATWSNSGRYGKALNFDTGQYVTMPSNNSISGISSAITLEAWVYHTSFASPYNSVQRYLTAPGEKAVIRYSGNSANPLQFYITVNGIQYTLNPAGTLNTNTWYHVVGTYDGTSQILYLNGSQVASQTVYGSLATTAGSVSMSSATERMKGMIDEAAVYNRALSSAEVLARYGAWLTTAVASDTTNNLEGIQADDKVVISFNKATNGDAVNAGNINTALALNGGHSWLDGSGNIGSAVWSTTTNANDTLTITLSAATSAPTVGPGDVITLGGTIKDTVGRGINDTVTISGNFGAGANEPLGAVGQWKFDEGAGVTAYDDTVNGNNGTVTGAAWTTSGRYGSALSFNGSNNYVEIPNSNSLNLSSAGTIEVWAKKNNNTHYQTYVSKGNSSQFQLMDQNTTGKITLRWGNDTDDIVSNTVLPTGVWNHIVATYDGTNLKLYINGALDKTVAYSTNAAPNTFPVRIGARADGLYFGGSIDEVIIYNRAISDSEVLSRYGSWISSINANAVNNASGIQSGDQVIIRFNQATNSTAPVIDNSNIATALQLNGGHSWGSITNAAWSNGGGKTNDTLTVTMNTGASLTPGDTITFGGGLIKDTLNRAIVDSMPISGNFGADPNEPLGAVANWKFNENTGTTTADATVNGNTGSLSGAVLPTWTMGRYSYGLSFNGTNSHVNVPDSNSLDLTSEGSLDAWVRMNGSNNDKVIISKGTAYKLSLNYAGKIMFTWGSRTITATTALEQTRWHHIVGTYKAGNLKLYIDGASAATTVTNGASITANTNDLKIGTDGTYFFNGWIDEVVVYNREISLSEVQSRYGTWLSSAVASDTTNNAKGIQTGDKVTIKFTAATNGAASGLSTANIDTVLNIGHSWGSVSSVEWASSPNTNDTLTVTLNTGATVGIGDTITLNGAIKDPLNRGINDSIAISGNFGADANEPLGAVGNWKFNENTGTTTADSTANGNNGTLSGTTIPTWATGRYSYGLSFNGTTAYVNVPDSNSLDLTTEGSLEGWVRMNGSNNNKIIMSKGTAYKLTVDAAGKIVFTWGASSITSTNPLEQTKWHHIVGTYSGGSLNLYIDGASAATTVTGGSSISGNSIDFKIGTDGTNFFNGWIDEVVVYNKALSLADVQARFGTWLSTATASDTTVAGVGVQGGDRVVIQFSGATNGQAINAGNIDTALALSAGHSWKDGSGAITSATWSTTTRTNDTLTIVMSGSTSLPTIAYGDTVTLDGTIKDNLNRSIIDSITINAGSFDIPNGATGYWRFNEGSGSAVSDTTANGLNGTAYHNTTPQGTWTTGKYGIAISLNGSADYVTYPNNSAFTLSGSYAIEAWIKPAEFKDDEAILFNGDGTAFRYNFAVYSDGTIGFSYLNSGSYTGRNIAKSTGTLKLNEWNHVVVTRNGGSGSTATFYINGVASGIFTDNHNETSPPTQVWAGKSKIGSAQPVYFNGAVDEMLIFNRSLSAADIKTRYRTWMKTVRGTDASGGGHGIQANDQVIIDFDGATNGPAINSGNINGILTLNNGHSWGNITAAWSINLSNNDRLTITLPATGSTIAMGDVITLDGVTIKDNINRSVSGSKLVTGTFSTVPAQAQGYWELNDTDGIIVDGTVNSNNGIVYNTIRDSGKLEAALTFNGTNAYAEVTNTNFSLANVISIEFWMKALPQPIGMGIIYGNSFGIKTAESNTINPGVITNNGWQGSGWAVSANLFDNNWHHVVLTWDGTTQIIYADGVAVGSAPGTGTLVTQSTMRLGNQLAGSYFFNGSIDEVVIYNKVLSPAEVLNRFNNP